MRACELQEAFHLLWGAEILTTSLDLLKDTLTFKR